MAAGSNRCDRGHALRVDDGVPGRAHRDRDGRRPGLGDRPDERRLARLAVRLDRPDDDGIERLGARPQAADLGIARGDRHDDVVDRCEPRPQRATQPWRDSEDVSAGVRSVGSGMIARIRVPGAKTIGAGSAPSTPRSSLVSARSASSREIAVCSAEPTTSRSGGVPAAASQDRRSARRALEASSSSGSNKPRAAAALSVVLDPALSGPARRGEEQIDPGADRGDDLHGLGRSLGQGVHVEGVADRQPAEAEPVAQRAAHDGP